MTLPVSGLVAIEAGQLVRKLDGADKDDTIKIIEELRALLAADGSSFHDLGCRIISPLPRLVYFHSGVSKFGNIVWDDDLRYEAIGIIEGHAWKLIRTSEEQRKVDGTLAALKSRKGRMTRSQADLAERIVRFFKDARP